MHMDMIYAANVLLSNVWFGRHMVGIPMGTYCEPFYNNIMSTYVMIPINDKSFKKILSK